MKHHIEIINGIKNTFIEMRIDLVTNKKIGLVTNKYKSLLNGIDEAHRCIRTLNADDDLIEKLVFIFRNQCYCLMI